MARAIITPVTAPLRGEIHLPGDKSVSHRRALLSLFVPHEVRLSRFGTGDDGSATLACLHRLGKTVSRDGGEVVIEGGLTACSADLDCGNSGTTARLLCGILSGQKGTWVLRGDASLSRRPMERVAAPLRAMGARIELTNGGLPARIEGADLHGIRYDSPVASAQVKSAVLLAGLKAEGITRYREPLATRDHTERLLSIAPDEDGWITLDPRKVTVHSEMLSGKIGADPSAAAFWAVAAVLISGSHVQCKSVLANPHRMGYIELLGGAGAKLSFSHHHKIRGEELADLAALGSQTKGFAVSGALSASMIDEIPVLAVLAARSEGSSEFRDVGELKVKESDRLHLITENLQRMGVEVRVWDDGFIVNGPARLRGAEITTEGDHRMAMAFAVAALRARGKSVIHNAECVRVSYPEFWNHLQQLAPGSVSIES
ncbi:MAG TPA: 3-phosphoshikimate 1-carboxyvinyltransferase [bacterium]|jgi:3-phosphoshikimate 1-carboxyvinyltransferase